jgi:hypothetical protein
MTVAVPTARDGVATSIFQSDNGHGNELLAATNTSVNPTFLQPWFAGLFIYDRFFMHEYLGVIVPTDGRIATFLNYDCTVGYSVYRAESGSILSSVTPTAGVHLLLPINHVGPPGAPGATTFVPFDAKGNLPAPPAPGSFTYPHQVYLTGGLQIGIGQRFLLSAAVIVPVSGPRTSTIGGTVGLNYFY